MLKEECGGLHTDDHLGVTEPEAHQWRAEVGGGLEKPVEETSHLKFGNAEIVCSTNIKEM